MNIQKSIKIILASAAMTAVAAGASFAQGNLTTGNNIVPTATTVSGTEVVFTSVPFAATNRYSGTMFSGIFQESLAANPLGGLTFVYQASNAASSLEYLDRVTPVGFQGFQTSAFYSTQALFGGLGAGVVAPSTVIRLLPTGDSLAFRFEMAGNPGQGIVQNGQTTDVVVVRTDAPSYTNSVTGISDGTTTNVPSYAPAPLPSSVPEPATLVPFALGGLGLLGLIVRKTRRTSGAAA